LNWDIATKFLQCLVAVLFSIHQTLTRAAWAALSQAHSTVL
jgi:hypothetical protein